MDFAQFAILLVLASGCAFLAKFLKQPLLVGYILAGVIIGVGGQQGNVLRLQPPLIITQEQLARAIQTVAEALTACHQPA